MSGNTQINHEIKHSHLCVNKKLKDGEYCLYLIYVLAIGVGTL